MTIGGWILFALVSAIIVGVCVTVAYFLCEKIKDIEFYNNGAHNKKTGMCYVFIVLDIILCGALIVGFGCFQFWYYGNTASGQRAFKDQESNFENGTERIVTIYDVNGEVIKQYDGRFDVETGNVDNAPYILFDDENGKRHIIYYTTGTVTIDEK